MRLALSMTAVVLLCGCNAPGWEPGPITEQKSIVPIPGLGDATFGGERDTTVALTGMRGVPGAAFPDIDSLIVTRSASGPLATRGGQQQAIELLRWQEAQKAQQMWQNFGMALLSQYVPTYQQRIDNRPPPDTTPSARDVLLEKLLNKLDSVIEKIPTSSPSK